VLAVIYIPDFFLQAALRSEPELRNRPVALVDLHLMKPTITQVTEAARQDGVVAGLTASQAVARCHELLIKSRNAAQELSASEVLWQSAYAFSPRIEATAPGICTMELRGLRLESETAAREWALKLLQTLSQFHLKAQIGFGPNPGVAMMMAQAAAPVLWMENPLKFVLDFPIEALHAPPEIFHVLEMWGVQTIGAFVALGKDQLAERLGTDALDLLDVLEAAPPLRLVSPPATFVERMEFEKEIETTEPLLFVLNRFLEQLARRLDTVYLVMAELHLQLTLASGASCERAFKIPSPTNHLHVLFRMLQTHLENLRTDSAIVALQLSAIPGKPEQHQFGLFDATLRNPNQFAETLARLTALCGENNVGTPRVVASHHPDAFRMTTPEFSVHSRPLQSDEPSVNSVRQGLQLRRFRPPISAYLEFRGQQPALIRSRPCNGAIAAVHGPFASSGDWWEQSASWAREEWDVQTGEGGLYRIFRSVDGCFVEGVYD
jgi:protein ImuB